MVDIDVAKGLEEAKKDEERTERLKRPKAPGEEYEYKVSRDVTPGMKSKTSRRHGLLVQADGVVIRRLDRRKDWPRNDISSRHCCIPLMGRGKSLSRGFSRTRRICVWPDRSTVGSSHHCAV